MALIELKMFPEVRGMLQVVIAIETRSPGQSGPAGTMPVQGIVGGNEAVAEESTEQDGEK